MMDKMVAAAAHILGIGDLKMAETLQKNVWGRKLNSKIKITLDALHVSPTSHLLSKHSTNSKNVNK